MASYGALWRARFEMMRPGNVVMAAVGVLVGIVLVSGYGGYPWEGKLAAMLAAAAITAFGNVMNDITDRQIDANAHPGRPLPSGRISLGSAKGFAVFLLAFGLLEAWAAGGNVLLVFAMVNAAVLALYDLRLKRWPLIGNVTVAALVASTIAFGAVAAGARLNPAPSWNHPGLADEAFWWILLMVFLTNLAREVLKDIEDAGADAGRRTLPMVAGPATAGWLASISVGIAVGIDAALVWTMDWWIGARTVLAGAGGAFLVASGLGCYQAGLGQRALKWAMVVALVGLFLVPFGPDGVR